MASTTNVKITGKFKSYEDLLAFYGTDETKPIDENFDAFLKDAAERDVVLTNYNGWTRTFDAAFLVEKPQEDQNDTETPRPLVQEIPFGERARHLKNIGIDAIDPSSIQCDNCTEHIFCKRCGFQVGKNIRYDFEPRFTYGDIFDGDCTENETDNISGAKIAFNACDDTGRMFCPNCRTYEFFEELSNTLP